MKRTSLLCGIAALSLAHQALAQDIPTGPSYPTNTTRPSTTTPRPRPVPQGGGMIIEPPTQQTNNQRQEPVAIATLDQQLERGWITQQQYDVLQNQIAGSVATMLAHVRRNASDAAGAQRTLNDSMLTSIASFGTSNPDTAALLAQMGYTPSPSGDPEENRRRAEAALSVIQNSVRSEQNAGNIVRPVLQDITAISNQIAATNLEMLRETGQIPPETLRQYNSAGDIFRDRVAPKLERIVNEHDNQIRNVARVLDERHDQIVNIIVARANDLAQHYGPDPRNWPQTPQRPAPSNPFSYLAILNSASGNGPVVAPPPAPRPNLRNLPALGGGGRPTPSSIPIPAQSTVDLPDPSPVPTPSIGNRPRPPVRHGTIPPADPYADFRVPQPGEVAGQTPSPRPRPRPLPPRPTQTRPTPPAPAPVVLIEVRRYQQVDELGHPRAGSGSASSSSGSVLDAILSRIPRLPDGSIDWAHVPMAVRAQIILAQARARGGGSATGGSGESGLNSFDGNMDAEFDAIADEQARLSAAAQRQTAQDARWRSMVDQRFGSDYVYDAYAANRTLPQVRLEAIYQNYDFSHPPTDHITPSSVGNSLSSLGNSLSSAGNSLSTLGFDPRTFGIPLIRGTLDYTDPAVESLNEVLYHLTQPRHRSPFDQSNGRSNAELADKSYSAGSFQVQLDPTGRWGRESGGYIAASLFSQEDAYLRELTANGRSGLDRLLAQPFNVILTWGANAFDLDLHLTGPLGANTADRFHIYFSAKGDLAAQPYAQLIKDCICNAGSEVILTSALNRGGVYRISVFNFGDPSATSANLSNASQATIQIVRGGTTQSLGNGTTIVGGRSILTVTAPNGQTGNTWIAAELDPKNGRITVPRAIVQNGSSDGVH